MEEVEILGVELPQDAEQYIFVDIDQPMEDIDILIDMENIEMFEDMGLTDMTDDIGDGFDLI